MRIGYFLSSEEFGPRELVRQAQLAEQAGFEGLWISDHFHPWNDEQGHSAFVWSTIGAIAQATSRMKLTTAVTCPTIRIHPAIIAQAAATSAVLLEGRFALGRRHRRGAQRAHPRRPLAGGRRAPGDARGGGRGDPHAVAGRHAEPSRAPLPGRERAHLRPARRSAADPRSRASARSRPSSPRASATATAPSGPTPRR